MKRGKWISAVAIAIGSATLVYALSGDTDLGFDPGSGVDDNVYALAVQSGDGKIIVGGKFTTVRGLVRNGIARVNTDGSGDATFNPGAGANGQVVAVAIQPSDGKILVGGLFTSFNGDTSHPNLVRLNTDGSIDGGFTNGTGVNGSVNAIAVQSNGKIVIGGAFTAVNGTTRTRVARLNTDGGVDGGFTDPVVNNVGFPIPNQPRVNSVAIQPLDGKIVIGGEFSSVNGNNRYFLARLNDDGTFDASFSSPGAYPGFSLFAVYTVLVQGDNKILATGLFPTSTGSHSILRLSGTDGTVDALFTDPFGNSSNASVYATTLQPADQKIIVAGSFGAVGATARRDIARLNTNGNLDGSFDLPGSSVSTVWIHALALQSDNKVLIGGELSEVVVTGRSRLERLTTGGGLDATFVGDTGPNGDVYAMALQSPSGKLAIGGFFTTLQGQSRIRVAQLNTDGSVDINFNPGAGANGGVAAIGTQIDGKVVIGGIFTAVNGVSRPRLARLNANGDLDTDFCSNPGMGRCVPTPGPGPDSEVDSIAVQPDGNILIGGYFIHYGATSIGHIARVTSNGTLDGSFHPGGGASALVSPTIYSIYLQGNAKILIAGSFTAFDGQNRNHVARLNSDGSLDANFVPNTGIIGGVLDFLAVAAQPNGKVIVGGAFFPLNGQTPARIARLNDDGSIDPSFTGTGTNGNVRSLLIQPDGKIVIAGEFTTVNGVQRNRVARLNSDGSLDVTFNPSPGANTHITTVLRQPDGKILVGGFFTSVNGNARWKVARLNNPGGCPFTDDPLVQTLTPIRAVHVTELRSCIDGARSAHSLSAFGYTHATIVAGTSIVTAIDITEMRTALADVYTAALQTPPTYTHSSISAGMTVTALDISELRSAALAAP